MPFDFSRVFITLWLIALTVLDVRRRQLPHALTTLPLMIIGGVISIRAVASIFGLAMPGQTWDNTAILLALAAILLSDTWLAIWPALAAIGSAFVLGTGVGQVIAVTWLLVLGISKAGILGEGDAKVVMILLALYPDVHLGAALLITLALVGAGLMLVQLRAAMPLWLLSIAHDLLAFKVPARTGEAGVLNWPLVPLLTTGALIYLWGVA
jgi:hypothetical protein